MDRERRRDRPSKRRAAQRDRGLALEVRPVAKKTKHDSHQLVDGEELGAGLVRLILLQSARISAHNKKDARGDFDQRQQ